MYYLLSMLVCFYLGWVFRDRYIRMKMSEAAFKMFNNDLFLVSNTFSYIQGLGILPPHQLEEYLGYLPDEDLLHERIMTRLIGCLIKMKYQ